MLRVWQAECADIALDKYCSAKSHFFCQATPGGGKTVLAAEIALRLVKQGQVELILCFSPSKSVASGIQKTFSKHLNCSFAGGLGSLGQSMTYQSIQHLPEHFWSTLSNFRVFVVFDEIHHCSGTDQVGGNAWGEQIITKIQSLATYTLALSGTPWRSDSLPIALANYTDPEGELIVDYQYTLKQAVYDKVCRSPKLVLVDNEQLTVRQQESTCSYSSIVELLKQTKTSYQSVIHNQKAMHHLLRLGCNKLNEIRRTNSRAAGLVVAASVSHANEIARMLTNDFGQSTEIVSYAHDNSVHKIDVFKNSNVQWIVSVGMVSEGTDIPRLQVCCHLSRIKTELYFRQVLGRILRVNNSLNQEAWFYTFAEPNFVEFAERIEEDIPNACQYIDFNTGSKPSSILEGCGAFDNNRSSKDGFSEDVNWVDAPQSKEIMFPLPMVFDELTLGQFKQRVISAFI